jgi:hypothetical protein
METAMAAQRRSSNQANTSPTVGSAGPITGVVTGSAVFAPAQPRNRDRVREWIRRYLPYEMISTACELGGAALAYTLTDSLAAAAVVGTLGAVIGYYATALITAVQLVYHQQDQRVGPMRIVVSILLALRSITVEFGPAECADTFGVRPLTYYLAPTILGNVIGGWVAAKLVSDAVFYLCAVISYEKFGGLIVRRDGDARTDPHSPESGTAA